MSLARNALLWASTNPTLSERLPRMAFVRRAVRRFMPGEQVDAALSAAERLKANGISSIVTRLGENLERIEEATEVRDHYRAVYDEIAKRDLDCWVSVKLTQLGLDLDPDYTAECLETLARKAREHGNMLWVDMESSEYVDLTLELFRALKTRHDNVGVCLQSYLYRTPDDLEDLLAINTPIRLVKGAYAEPPDLAYPDKADVDRSYYEQALELLEHARRGGAVPGIATHDEGLVERIEAAARDGASSAGASTAGASSATASNAGASTAGASTAGASTAGASTAGASPAGASPAPYEIQMLYGIASAQQMRWAAEGRRVRVLISYGEAWYPWYMRRLAERPANIGFVFRNMLKG